MIVWFAEQYGWTPSQTLDLSQRDIQLLIEAHNSKG